MPRLALALSLFLGPASLAGCVESLPESSGDDSDAATPGTDSSTSSDGAVPVLDAATPVDDAATPPNDAASPVDAADAADAAPADSGAGPTCATNAQCGANRVCVAGQCECQAGFVWSGTPSAGACVDLDECQVQSNRCGAMQGSSCNNSSNGQGYTCTCPSGYVSTSGASPVCQDINECNSSNGGCAQTCANTTGAYTCSCGVGFTLAPNGLACNDVDECSTNNGGCSQFAVCSNLTGSRSCACQSGFTGDGVTCTNVNECTQNVTICGATLAVGICSDTTGSYSCACGSGYAPLNGTCQNVNECTAGSSNPCGAGTCADTSPSYTCSCSSGYALGTGSNGSPTCQDVNECNSNNGGCAQNCANTQGSFACSCTSFYQLAPNGTSCSDIDECLSNNGGCAGYATCANNSGAAPTCTCQAGFTGNGTTCTNVNECNTVSNVCGGSTAGTCTDNAGSYSCGCNAGFSLGTVNGQPVCQDVNECNSGSPCGAGATCSNTAGSYTCSCPSGYQQGTVNGAITCVDINECNSNNGGCSSNGVCANTAGSFTCTCNANYYGNGTYCQFVDQVTIGDNFQCVRTRGDNTTARAYCWGDNSSGQLGDGTTTTRNYPSGAKPVNLAGILSAGQEVQTIKAGAKFACATYSVPGGGSNVACWGDNTFGQLGANATALPLSHTPVTVTMGPYVQNTGPLVAGKLALGKQHACGYNVDSTSLYCWGDNSWGQLAANSSEGQGNNTYSSSYYARPWLAQKDALGVNYLLKDVAASSANTCALLGTSSSSSNLAVRCAGATSQGSGSGAVINSATAAEGGACNVLSSGYQCVTQLSKTVTFATIASTQATPVKGLTAGANHFAVIGSDGWIYSWGSNSTYVFGDGSTSSNTTAQRIQTGSFSGLSISKLFAGGTNGWAITSDKQIFSSGQWSAGQAGNGAASATPGVYGSRASAVYDGAAGIDRTCIITAAFPPQLLCAGADTGSGSLPSLGTTPIGGSAPTNRYFNTVYWN